MEANPLNLSQRIEAILKKYILTTLTISHNYPRLREQFSQLVNSQQLIQGPFIEALPDFEKGKTLRQLLFKEGGYLHDGLADLPNELLDRPLHRHQEEALERSCVQRESLLMATGTGSGKTETFIYPIAHSLLGDPEPDASGVRALIIYPMNALANDQLFYRIAPLFGRWLGRHNITFGRYTSQIKANALQEDEEARLFENSRLMDLLGGEIPSTWLLTREAMLCTPPKILLTNYAMLEHLLLLPRNAALFAQPTLRFIVLDEIHTYTGAQATEVAFLLRKLKNRLGITNSLQVFGTSASLSNDENANAHLLPFASALFGEEVHAVVRGKREQHAALRIDVKNLWSLTTAQWIDMGKLLAEVTQHPEEDKACAKGHWNERVQEMGLFGLRITLEETLSEGFLRIFRSNQEIRRTAAQLATGEILPFIELAKCVFPDAAKDVRAMALNFVIRAGMLARKDFDTFPLLPGRYHIAATGIEGICLSLDPTFIEGWGDMRPFRNAFGEDGRPYYPLLVCRRCGQPFLEGFSSRGYLFPTTEEGSMQRRIFWLGLAKAKTLDENDEETEKPQDAKPTKTKGRAKARGVNEQSTVCLDPVNGSLGASPDKGVKLYEVATHHDEVERKLYVRTCPACGAQAGGSMAEIVTAMHPGDEAMGAVICQQVLEFLPPDKEHNRYLPLGGRNLLTFADNRQDAAFFAPYFERTSNELALRTGAFQVLEANHEECFSFDELAEEVLQLWKREAQPVIMDGTGHAAEKRNKQLEIVAGQLAAEFCTPGGRRVSLEALGVVQVVYEETAFRQLVNELSKAMPHHCEEVASLAHILLEHIRREKAITAPANGNADMTDATIWGDLYIQHRAYELQRTQNSSLSHAWMPAPDSRRHNRRTWYLVERLGWSWDETRDFLCTAWEAMKKAKLLVPLKPGFGLDVQKIRIALADNTPLYRCSKCGLAALYNVECKCSAFRCSGDTILLDKQKRQDMWNENHYLAMLKAGKVVTLRAREHTAVLSQEIRQEIEQDFADKKINLLSCTTTMEMGVDLGELEAVVCMNIPPKVSNYHQRTGRAGRRAQAAPFCVTLAKSGRYDQSVFRDFRNYLHTPPPIPRVHLRNAQLFQRHQFSILLSGFLRHRIKDTSINAPSLSDFFGDKFDLEDQTRFIEDLQYWLESPLGRVCLTEAERLVQLVSENNGQDSYIYSSAFKNAFLAAMERFSLIIMERWSTYHSKRQEYAAKKAFQQAAHWDKQAKQFMGQFLINRFSLHGMIPTYSFPVHSLSLEVVREQRKQWQHTSSDVALARDAALGISEYAPSSRVVANGRVWTSAGLAYSPRQFMPERMFLICPKCNHVEIKEEREDLASECPFCDFDKRGLSHPFIEPIGFVTDYHERDGSNPGQVRPRRLYADEARLISQARDKDFKASGHPAVRKALLPAQGTNEVEAGQLFVVNKGPCGHGFHRCYICNRMEPAFKITSLQSKHHDIRTGISCTSSKLSFPICLAHTFNTDIAIFRFTEPFPDLDGDLGLRKPDVVKSMMATTLSEAMRFGATDLLQIQDNELRSSFKLRGAHADIILYDAIPGGAGYATALQEVSMNDLLCRVAERLRCPNGCAMACRACLCDYSNQLRWSAFNRKPVLKWLEGLLRHQVNAPVLGAELWETCCLEALTRRLASLKEIHLSGNGLLGAATEPEGEGMTWLLRHLNEKRTVVCHLTQSRPYRPTESTSSVRLCWSHLRPYLQEGRLVLTHIPNEKTVLPRVFATPAEGAPAFFSEYCEGFLLEDLLPSPVYTTRMSAKLADEIQNTLTIIKKHPTTVANESAPEIFLLDAGMPRNISQLFKNLHGAHIEHLSIEDPYCGIRQHRGKLIHFVKDLTKIIGAVEKVSIICKEPHYNDKNWESRSVIHAALENDLISIKFFTFTNVKVIDFISGRMFHDRSLRAKIIGKDGSSSTHIYDLSGGIDYLVDETRSTKIYHYVKYT
jgi:hypothetical protein